MKDISASVSPSIDQTSVSPTARSSTTPAWSSLLLLAAGHFAVDFCTGVWPVFKTLAQLDIAKAGLIATAGAMAGNGLQLVFGWLADHGWRKALLIAGVSMAGAVTFVPWAVSSYPLMFALVLVTYVGSAAYHPSGTGAAGAASRTRTGVTIGIFLAGGYGGYSLSQLLFSAVYRDFPMGTPVMLLVPLAAAAGLASSIRSTGSRSRGGGWRGWRLRWRPLSALFAVQVFASSINVALIFLLPDLLLARQAPDWMVQGGGHFALVAGACFSLLPAGHASDRWGARRVLLLANTGTGILLALLLSRGSASAWDLAIVAGFGACNGMNNVVSVAEGNRMLAGQTSGVSALLMGMPWFFSATASVIAGVLADPVRGGTPSSALTWMALAIPLALAASSLVQSERDRESDLAIGRRPRADDAGSA